MHSVLYVRWTPPRGAHMVYAGKGRRTVLM